MIKRGFYLLILFVFVIACSNNPLNREWLFPTDKIDSALNNNDDIPSINNPQFLDISQVDFLVDSSRLIVVKINDIIRAYPINILEWHEIVNDQIENTAFTVSYSTLSAVSSVWNRRFDDRQLEFAVSRYVYHNNLICYDKETLNYWSQILGKSVSGNFIGAELDKIAHIEMNWLGVQNFFPDAQILSDDTGFVRNYMEYPYSDYRTSSDFIFEPDSLNNRLPYKSRVLSHVIDSNSIKVYTFNSCASNANDIDISQDQTDSTNVIVLGSIKYNFLTAFSANDGTLYALSNDITKPHVFMDDLGNEFSIWGEAISGPNQGSLLERPDYKMGYWFVWYNYFSNISIY